MAAAEASVCMLPTEAVSTGGCQEEETGRKPKAKCPALVSPVPRVELCCCSLLITVLTAVVIGLSVALSMRKPEPGLEKITFATCPRNWIGFGSKCFYFSEDMRNYTHSQNSCMALEAQLAQFESLEELNFLRRYMGSSDHWIGLHRESSRQPWKWTDNTEYNNLVSIGGVAECAYLNDNRISSARNYIQRKWICSKPSNYTLKVP